MEIRREASALSSARIGDTGHFSVPTDPTGRLGHQEAMETRSALAANEAYNSYLAKSDPRMAQWNSQIAQKDAEDRLAFLLALHDKHEAVRNSEVANTLAANREYIATSAKAAAQAAREPHEI